MASREDIRRFWKAHGTLIDDRFIGPGAAEIAAANASLKDHPIPETFSMEGAGLRMCDEPS